jgi:glycosyltransferase involved in cell wall biosynthesis
MNALTSLPTPSAALPVLVGAASKLRIGLLIHSLLPGGAERVCSLLASHWAQQGHAVTLMTYASPDTDAYAVSPAVQRVVIGGEQLSPNRWHSLRKNTLRVRRVRRQMQTSRMDVAVSFMSVSNSCLAVAGLGTGVVCIGSERTYPPAMALTRLGELARWALYGWLDAVVAQTEDAAQWLRQHTRARKVAAIANPVCLPLPGQEPRLEPSAWRRVGAPLLLAVGRLSEEKRFDVLLRAFAQARVASTGATHHGSGETVNSSTPASWQLALIGEGPEREMLQNLVTELGLQDHVLMPGRAGNVADWYAAADAFALTSRFEGYPNALLEALASGVPAVACDCLTGPRELIQDGVNGLLVAPDSPSELTDALARVMADPALRQRLSGQAHLTVDSHTIERIGARWEAVFTQVLARRGTA